MNRKNILIISSQQITHCLSINSLGRCLNKNNFQVDLLASTNAAFVCKGSNWINQWVTATLIAGENRETFADYFFVIDDKSVASLPDEIKKNRKANGEPADSIYLDTSSLNWVKAHDMVLKLTGTEDDGMGWNFVVPAENKITENDLPTGHLPGYIVLALDKSDYYGDEKRLVSFIMSVDFPFILVGHQDCFTLAERIAANDKVKIYNACGKFNLYEMADIIQRSRLLVSHENLWMYLGLAVKQNMITINSNLTEMEVLKAYGSIFYSAQKKPVLQNVKLRKRWFFPTNGTFKLMTAVNKILRLQ